MADTRVASPLTCGRCPSTWSGLSRAHCSACHLTFTGITAFDRHRSDGGCASPVDLGMVLREGGIWGAPAMTPEQIDEVWGSTS